MGDRPLLFNIAIIRPVRLDVTDMSAAAYADFRRRAATMPDKILDGTAGEPFDV